MAPYVGAARSENSLPDQIDNLWLEELASGRVPDEYCGALHQISTDLRLRFSQFVSRLNNEIQQSAPGSPHVRAFQGSDPGARVIARAGELWVGDAELLKLVPDRLNGHVEAASALSSKLDDLSRHAEQSRLSCVSGSVHLFPQPMHDKLDDCRANPAAIHRSLVRRLVEAGVRSVAVTCYNIEVDIDHLKLDSLELNLVGISMFDAESVSAGSLIVRNSHFENCKAGRCDDFNLSRATFSEQFRIQDSKLGGQLNAAGMTVGGKTTIERTEIDAAINSTAMDGFDAKFHGGLTIIDSQFNGRVFLRKIEARELSFAGNHIEGHLTLFGARVTGPSFIGLTGTGANLGPGNTITKNIEAYYFEGDDLQLESNAVRGNIELQQSKFDGRASLNNLIVGRSIFLTNTRANTFEITGLNAQGVDLGAAKIATNITLRRIVTKTLDFSNVRAGSLDVDGEKIAADWLDSAQKSRRADGSVSNSCHTQVLPSTDASPIRRPFPTKDGRGVPEKLSREARIHQDNKIGCADRMSLSGSQIEGSVTLGGIVRQAVDLNQLTVGSTIDLSGDVAAFGRRVCVSAEGLKADTLVADMPDTTAPGELGLLRRPQFIELNSSAIRVIRPSDSDARGGDAIGIMSMFLRSPGDSCDDQEGMINLAAREPERPNCAPAVFDVVASGYQAAGYSDIAREIRIEKNRAYSSSLMPRWNEPLAGAEVVAWRTGSTVLVTRI